MPACIQMQVDPDYPVRRRIRLRSHDYATPGAYFVTVCTWQRACALGRVIDDAVVLSDSGTIAHRCWQDIPSHFPNVELDAFVVMPNHVHGIINIIGAMHGLRATHASPLPCDDVSVLPVSLLDAGSTLPETGRRRSSLGTIVGAFKAAVSRSVNESLWATHASPLPRRLQRPLWQRGYYEHVIRDEAALLRLRQYIIDNPARWAEDPDNTRRYGQAVMR